jgi:hypothetical protein
MRFLMCAFTIVAIKFGCAKEWCVQKGGGGWYDLTTQIFREILPEDVVCRTGRHTTIKVIL